ncbi:hypothetical protein QJ036_08085 [Ruminococcus sp. YH-rum2234]|uniref:Uncharacterized protein n=1 Tax=Fusibacillus kribbianus TaxID=3044208 RepID=A0AAP4BB63_9FIRM|nr:hypothetical protein [Ruminococcus sp. YH-rum2234]
MEPRTFFDALPDRFIREAGADTLFRKRELIFSGIITDFRLILLCAWRDVFLFAFPGKNWKAVILFFE